MYNSVKNGMKLLGAAVALSLGAQVLAADIDPAIAAIGRTATPAEIAAWDIDVRPDFKGLPEGSGTAEDGEEIWLEKCAVCHGDFGDSNEVFSPLALGNVTDADIESGRVAALKNPSRTRTTLMKVATLSTLFDYINRAMPWNAPKSLETDEVYSLVAYLLSLGYIVEPDFELNQDTVAEVQARMPNRNGMTTDHGLWSVDGKPDVVGSKCTKNCKVDTTITSRLPDFAMNAHGNLKHQSREYTAIVGMNTAPEEAAQEAAEPVASADPMELLQANTCTSCHQMDSKLVGPAFRDVQEKYADRDDAVSYLVGKIRNGGSGVWGGMMMPPMPNVSEEDATAIATWLAGQ